MYEMVLLVLENGEILGRRKRCKISKFCHLNIVHPIGKGSWNYHDNPYRRLTAKRLEIRSGLAG